jgi:hypothetical protein
LPKSKYWHYYLVRVSPPWRTNNAVNKQARCLHHKEIGFGQQSPKAIFTTVLVFTPTTERQAVI